MPVVLDEVLGYLSCPYCGALLSLAGQSARCASGHSYDIARQGYLNLLPPGFHGGDTAAMIAARAAFLAGGHFAPLAAAVAQETALALADQPQSRCVAEVGAGTGYYLAAALDQLPGRPGLALDASKYALRRAARAHPSIGAVGCDIWHGLPVADGAAAALLDIFAPRNSLEFHRILAPAGTLIVVTPNPDHLRELAPLGLLTQQPAKAERIATTLSPHFALEIEREVARTMQLTHTDIHNAVFMGPTARHINPDQLRATLAQLPPELPVTLSVTLSCWRCQPDHGRRRYADGRGSSGMA
jgi:23S rRNA (guanine745-N1)-methyltransferase